MRTTALILMAISIAAASRPVIPAASSHPTRSVDVVNEGSTIREPVITVTPAVLKEYRETFRPDGLPNIIEIAAPEGAATLSLTVRAERPDKDKLELYLYDCTTGECFSYDIKFPAGPEHTLVVRRPNAGRWVAAVNSAPFPTSDGGFVLEEVIASGSAKELLAGHAMKHGERWTAAIDTAALPKAAAGGEPILFVELLDKALEKDEAAYPWDPSPKAVKLRDRPVALGTAIVRQ